MAERIFLSYGSTDRTGARKLHAALEQQLGTQDFTFFFDQQSLRAGDRWEGEILEALRNCAHMVVLWSAHAKASDWVTRERGHFDARIHADPRLAGSRLLYVLLDDEPHAHGALQTITALRAAPYRDLSLDQLPDAAWRAVAEAIESAVTGATPRQIPVAALTITNDRLRSMDFSQRPDLPDALSLDRILEHLGIASTDDLARYYGETRLRWRPFGGDLAIEQILDNVRRELNRDSDDRFRWEWVDDALWADDARVMEAAAERLSREQAVIVIDPLALYDARTKALLGRYLHLWLDNERATIMVLSIYPTWERPRYLRQMVSQMNSLIISRYDNPTTMPNATCSVFTGDEFDIKRLLRSMVKAQMVHKAPKAVFLRSA